MVFLRYFVGSIVLCGRFLDLERWRGLRGCVVRWEAVWVDGKVCG